MREVRKMKKSEIRLIICGVASLVISVILAVITVFVFIANYTMSGELNKISNGFNTICNTVESVADDIGNTDVDIDVEQIGENIAALERITG